MVQLLPLATGDFANTSWRLKKGWTPSNRPALYQGSPLPQLISEQHTALTLTLRQYTDTISVHIHYLGGRSIAKTQFTAWLIASRQ
jgi:hypothetical protein